MLSINNHQEGMVLCISENSVELEKPLQICEHHTPTNTKNLQEGNCTDHELPCIAKHQSNLKIKFINKAIKAIKAIYKLNFTYKNYEYKISLKEELKKKINYYQKNLIPNQRIKQIKTTIILT